MKYFIWYECTWCHGENIASLIFEDVGQSLKVKAHTCTRLYAKIATVW